MFCKKILVIVCSISLTISSFANESNAHVIRCSELVGSQDFSKQLQDQLTRDCQTGCSEKVFTSSIKRVLEKHLRPRLKNAREYAIIISAMIASAALGNYLSSMPIHFTHR